MRRLIALGAAAPLALLAACGDAPVEEDELDIDMAGTGLEAPDVSEEEMPQVTENSLDSVDYGGTYTMTGLDGSTSSVTLDPEDNTYEYTNGAGATTTGEYTRMDDGSRIRIFDFEDGEPGFFSIADGAIYRLPGEDTPYNEITVTGMYSRDRTNAAQTGGPGATTATVGDKRD